MCDLIKITFNSVINFKWVLDNSKGNLNVKIYEKSMKNTDI